ncbi:putative ribonuclease H-like domain-containing protein [Tanacetum coccineum]
MGNYYTTSPRVVNTARPQTVIVNTVRAKRVNAVKTSTCWVWRPTRPNGALLVFKRHNYIDGKPQKDDTGFINSGCSRQMTGNIAYLLDFKEFDRGYVTFGGGAHGGRISSKGTLKTDSLDFEDFPDESQVLFKIHRNDNMYSFAMKNIVPKESLTCLVAKATLEESMLWHRREKGIRREYSVARTPQQNGVAERRNRTLIEAARTIGFKPALSFMRPFGCHVTILNTLGNLGKFDGKSDEGFFVGYSLSSKAFRVYNTRTKKVEQNLHIRFLENKPMIKGNGPKWLFDIDSLTQSMNYVPVVVGTISNKSAGTQGELNAGISTQKEEINQDCIVMQIWKDASYFDSPSKDVGNDEPKSAADDQEQVEDGPHNESDEKDKPEDDSSPNEVNAARQHVTTASPKVNTGRFKLNTVDPSVNTASSYDPDSPNDMFKLGAGHTLEATHVEFFSNEDEPEVDLGNISNSYTVPTTPNTRIHKDHPIKNVLGEVKSSVQTRRMTKPTSEQGFLSVVYEEKSHDTLNTCRSNTGRTSTIQTPTGLDTCGFAYGEERAFLYETIEKEVYVTQPPGLKDPNHRDKVYKVVKELYGLHQAPKACQDKYVDEILKKFNYTDVKSASTLVDLENPLVKDRDANDVDVHLYRSMIGSLMYLTTSRPDIIYLKGKPTLGLWYSRDSPFELVAYTDSDYAGATQDRKSITGGYLLTKGFDARSLVVPLKKVGDDAVHKELGDKMERVATTASSLEAEQESGNINKTQSMAILNGSSPEGTGSGCGPRCRRYHIGGCRCLN